MQGALRNAEVAVGCHSTGVLEALVVGRPPVFIRTHKWGDYYDFASSRETQPFLADSPDELLARIRTVRTLPDALLGTLRERYFGDPAKNGSEWVVEQLREYSQRP